MLELGERMYIHDEHVYLPIHQLMEQQMEECVNRCVLCKISDFLNSLAEPLSICKTSDRYKGGIGGHIGYTLVMIAVGDLPPEVGYKEGGVENKTKIIIKEFRGGERLMTAFVSKDPNPATKESLNEGVQ